MMDELAAGSADRGQLPRIGEELIHRLFVLAKNVALFEIDNDALKRPIQLFLASLGELHDLKEPKAHVTVANNRVFLNHQRLRMDEATYENSKYLMSIYKKLGIQEMGFDTSWEEEDLKQFLVALSSVFKENADVELLDQVKGLSMLEALEEDDGDEVEWDERVGQTRHALEEVSICIAAVAKLMAAESQGVQWNLSGMRRVAQDLVDAAGENPDAFLAMFHIKVNRCALAIHLIRTAIVSILLARKLGLSRIAQAEAAMIALCHHLWNPSETDFHRTDEQEVADEEELRERAFAAARGLFDMGVLNEKLIRLAISVFELVSLRRSKVYRFHDQHDPMGIVAGFAHEYVSMAEKMTPDLAVGAVLQGEQKRNKTLCMALMAAMGRYPVGTMLKLIPNRKAIVVASPRTRQQLDAPVVRILSDKGSNVVDLSKSSEDSASIVRAVDPRKAGVNVLHYLLRTSG